ncbi:MAG: glycosyltransferase, partial [Gammaproteobacteria bacterium]|nr:glycosyltransferase [Gammaproteobacteria bacterium]
MKKILFLMDHFKNPYAGTEGQLYALIHGLQEQGISTELAVFRNSEYINSGQFPGKIQILNVTKMLHIMTLIRLIKLALYCRREKYELIHIYFNDASVIAPMILSLFGLKVIISRRDMGYWYNTKLLKILRWNARFHKGCICNSEAVKQITMEQEHIPERKMYVVHNGLPKNKIPEKAEHYTLHQIGLVAN